MGIVTLADHVASAGLPFDRVQARQHDGIPIGVWLTGAPILWRQGIDGTSTVVGVIDTGVDDSHPDLLGKVVGRRDYVADGAQPSQFHYHGTHVAGTVAANGRVKGVAPNARLRDYRVLDRGGNGTNENVTQAIRDAADDGCHIITMSLGSPDDYPPMHDAIIYAISKGSLVIVAVGNDGPGRKSYPGYYHEVVGVAAIYLDTETGLVQRAWFSETNDEVDVCAHGTDVLSTFPGGLYGIISGTSMSTPHVAGVAALIAQKAMARLGHEMTEPTMWDALKGATTVDLSGAGVNAQTGAGLVTFYPAMPTLKRLSVTIGVKTITVDGQATQIDVAPVVVDNHTLTPMRATHEALGDMVDWDEATLTATAARWTMLGATDGQPLPIDVFPAPYTGPI
jgi:major intracellular serine protease